MVSLKWKPLLWLCLICLFWQITVGWIPFESCVLTNRWVHMRHFSLPTWTEKTEKVSKGVDGSYLQWVKLHVTLKLRAFKPRLSQTEAYVSSWKWSFSMRGFISNTLWWCDRCDSDQCVFEGMCLIYKWKRTSLNGFAREDVKKNVWSWTQTADRRWLHSVDREQRYLNLSGLDVSC